jgi:hypothetical protein
VYPAGIAVEVDDPYEVSLISIHLFLRNTLRNDVGIVIDTKDRVVVGEVAEDFVMMDFVDPDLAAFLLVLDLSLLRESLD